MSRNEVFRSNGNNQYLTILDSIEDFIDTAEQRDDALARCSGDMGVKPIWEEIADRLSKGRSSWYSFPEEFMSNLKGNLTWESFRKMFKAPWQSGMQSYSEFRSQFDDSVITPPTDLRRRLAWNEVGGQVSVDRAMRGELEVYRAPSRQRTTMPTTYTILIPESWSASVRADRITWTAVAASVLIDVLEQSGRSAEVYGMHAALRCYADGGGQCQISRIKRSSDPLDVATLMNYFSPWRYRSCGFAITHGRPKVAKHRGSYGYPCTPKVSLLSDGRLDPDGMSIWDGMLKSASFDASVGYLVMNQFVQSRMDAQRWIQESLRVVNSDNGVC